jgi:hypothetical protein
VLGLRVEALAGQIWHGFDLPASPSLVAEPGGRCLPSTARRSWPGAQGCAPSQPSVVLGGAVLLPAVCWPLRVGTVLSAFSPPVYRLAAAHSSQWLAFPGLQMAAMEVVCFLPGEQP